MTILGRVSGEQTPVGIVPKIEELNLEGFTGSTEDLKEVLRIDKKRWLEEMEAREEHLNCFDSLPKEIWEAHLRVRKALES